MRILITRPEPDASATAQLVLRAGHAPVLAPVLRIEPIANPQITPPYQAMLLTSAQAIAPLAKYAALKDTLVLCVGDKTARQAQELGFAQVLSASGNADALLALCRATLLPTHGKLLYACGEERTGALNQRLEQAGFTVDLVEVYRAIPLPGLPETVIADLQADQIEAVVLTSPRSATLFIKALQQAHIPQALQTMLCLCLSPAIAQVMSQAGAQNIRTSAHPDIKSLIELLA